MSLARRGWVDDAVEDYVGDLAEWTSTANRQMP